MTDEHTEYRLVVRLGRDMPNGLKGGEDFLPFSTPALAPGNLYEGLKWWQSAGHMPRLEKRQVITTYTDWEEAR